MAGAAGGGGGAHATWERPNTAAELRAAGERQEVDLDGLREGTLHEAWATYPELAEAVIAKCLPHFAGGLLGGAGAHRLWIRLDRGAHALLHYLHRECEPAAAVEEGTLRPEAEDGSIIHAANGVAFCYGPLYALGHGVHFEKGGEEPAEVKAALGGFLDAVKAAFAARPAGARQIAMARWWGTAPAIRCLYVAGEGSPGAVTMVRCTSVKADRPIMAIAIGSPQCVRRDEVTYDLLPGQAAVFTPYRGVSFTPAVAGVRGVGGVLFVEPVLEGDEVGGPVPEVMVAARAASETVFRKWNQASGQEREELTAAYFEQPALELPCALLERDGTSGDHAGAGAVQTQQQSGDTAVADPPSSMDASALGAALGKVLVDSGVTGTATSEGLRRIKAELTKHFTDAEHRHLRMNLGDKVEKVHDDLWLRTVAETGSPECPCLPQSNLLDAAWPLFNQHRFFRDWHESQAVYDWKDLMDSVEFKAAARYLYVDGEEDKRVFTAAEVAEKIAASSADRETREMRVRNVASVCYKVRDFMHVYLAMKRRHAAGMMAMSKLLRDETLLRSTEAIYRERALEIFDQWVRRNPHFEKWLDGRIADAWARQGLATKTGKGGKSDGARPEGERRRQERAKPWKEAKPQQPAQQKPKHKGGGKGSSGGSGKGSGGGGGWKGGSGGGSAWYPGWGGKGKGGGKKRFGNQKYVPGDKRPAAPANPAPKKQNVS